MDSRKKEYDALLRQPFFKREIDQSQNQRLNEMEKKVMEREKGIRDTKEKIIKFEQDILSYNEEGRKLKSERDLFNDEIERFKV